MQKTKNPYAFFNNYCLRTPLLILETTLKDVKKTKIEDEYLKEKWKNDYLKIAIFLASPYLYSELELLFNGRKNNTIKEKKLKESFLKYIIRASVRCTPFGLFAGISLGEFDTETNIVLKSNNKLQQLTRLDMSYVVALSSYLINEPIIRKQLLFYPNNSLYKIGDQYRYMEYQLEDLKRSYSIEGIESSVYIEDILNEAKKGRTIEDLTVMIVNEDITVEKAVGFINQLIDNQLLTSELEPSVTGEDMFLQIISVLKRLKDCKYYTGSLISLQQTILKLDNNIIKDFEKCYPILDSVGCGYEKKYVFQTDLFMKAKRNVLNKKIGYDLRRALPLLNILNDNTENTMLKKFKKAFLERYETRKIPLSQALDTEMGIGYIQNIAISDTVPFLSDITPYRNETNSKGVNLSRSEIIIQKLLFDALKNKEYNIALKEDTFKNIDVEWGNLPDTFSALIEVVIIGSKEFIYINSFGGSSGANLLTRFCNGSSKLFKYVKKMTAMEQEMNPNIVLVEIVHLPEARVGNVIKRPNLRGYEIPYLGKSNLPLEKQIDVNDILVFIKNDNIVLWSKKLNKEIKPCLTNAHNYTKKSLPIYHFLCDLQTQNTKSKLGFSWKGLSKNQSFLPRVTYNNIILSKATWVVDTREILKPYKNDNDLLSIIEVWREDFLIPQYVQLKESDNTLLINLENITMIQLLLSSVKNMIQFTLEEFLFVKEVVVKNENNENFTNQVVVSFYNETKLKKVRTNAK